MIILPLITQTFKVVGPFSKILIQSQSNSHDFILIFKGQNITTLRNLIGLLACFHMITSH